MKSRLQGWLPLAILPATIAFALPADSPRWLLMWSLSFAIYGSCKWLTWRTTPTSPVPVWRHFAYLLAWPGLDAPAFLAPSPQHQTAPPKNREWYVASLRLLSGLLLVWGIAPLIPTDGNLIRGWFGIIGLLQILHFGLFALLSCHWRSLGLDAKPLMQQPIRSTSLSEFWSLRWNTAFRDLTYQFLFQPLTRKFGPIPAMWIGFFISGLIHEFVISFPAGGGYGGPTSFFLLQAIGLSLERSTLGKSLGLRRGWRGKIFTLFFLLAPITLLAHPPFVLNVIVPFLHAIGASQIRSQ